MPLHQDIEGGHGEREPRLKILPHAVHDVLEVADERQHRKHRLDEHTVLPLAARTQFEVGRIALRGMKGGITQDNQGVLVKRGQLTRPSFGMPRTFERSRVPGSLPMAEAPCCPQAQSWALGMCQLLPKS